MKTEHLKASYMYMFFFFFLQLNESVSKVAVNFALYTNLKVFMYSHVCNINNDDMIYRIDTTRVEYIIPLRESFSLPFLWVQIAATTYYFRHNCSPQKEVLLKMYHNCPFLRSPWYFKDNIIKH